MRIALASCRSLPVPAADEGPLLAALAALGVEAHVHPWDDPTVDWAGYHRCVIRSTWDYPARVREFTAWAVGVGASTELWNPAPVIAWNVHKAYLLDLAGRGVPVVPTEVLPAGSAADLADLRRHWGAGAAEDPSTVVPGPGAGTGAGAGVVIKPAVSAGAHETHRVRADDPFGQSDLDRLLAAGDVLVQPYVAGIATSGETAVVVLGGEVSHAWVKRPAPGDFRVQEHHGGTVEPVAASVAQLAVVEAALGAVGSLAGSREPVRYARVDLVDIDGMPHLMELELVEPDLHLRHADGAVDRFAEALARP